MRRWLCASAVMVGASVVSPVLGETITIGAAADNTLYEDPTGATSNGAGRYLFAGLTAAESRRRGLIRFDVASALPAGVTVQSVSLTLHLSRTITGTEEVALHRVLASWGEGASVGFGEEGAGAPAEGGDATWLHRKWDSLLWAMPGGDFGPAASASALVVGPEFYSWSSGTMAAEVQTWLDAPALNFGWMILGNEAAPSTAKRFDSRDHDDPSVRPVLTVTFVPAPASVLASAAAMILWNRRRRLGS